MQDARRDLGIKPQGKNVMKGHLRERSPGHWAIVIDLRDPATGKRRRKWHSFTGTKRAAQIECARLISEMQRGTYLEPNKTTVAQFLDRWLADVKANGLVPRRTSDTSRSATRTSPRCWVPYCFPRLKPVADIRGLRQGAR